MSHSHHKRRAPAPPSLHTPPSRPPAPFASAAAPPPRPPSMRTLPADLPNLRGSSDVEPDSYPEKLNPFCDADEPPPRPPPLPPSVSNDSLPPPGRGHEPVPRTTTREEHVTFEYHGKNPFDMDSDDDVGAPEQPKAPAAVVVPANKSADADVSFEYRGKNPFDMDSSDDTGSHDLSSTSGSSLRTSVLRKKRHAPPPPPRPTHSPVPPAASDENGSLTRPEKNNGVSPVLGPPANEISPSSTNSGNDVSLTEAASEPPPGRKRISALPDEEPPQPPAANVSFDGTLFPFFR